MFRIKWTSAVWPAVGAREVAVTGNIVGYLTVEGMLKHGAGLNRHRSCTRAFM